ncbi:MAG: hypothetical protein PUP92_05890 [Rhizonema sp. PD38]|nr:hypothetical protein [Rhizonema sp. PD38]
METIRQVIQVGKSRQIQLTLPESIEPGLIEMVIVLQPVANQTPETVASCEENQINLFGFLPQRVDSLLFQKQIRKEWGE